MAGLGLAGCASPVRQPALPPTFQPVLYKTHAVMTDGYRLPYSVWPPVGEPKAVVLALHGFNDYRNAFAEAGPAFARQGVITYAYDQRGFGQTAFRGLWPGTERMVSDVYEFATLLHARHPGPPLYLLGESMGGAVAITALAKADPELVDGLVLVAPAVWGRRLMNPFIRLTLWAAERTFPGHRVTGRQLRIRASDNREMLRALGRDPLVIKETRIDTIGGLSDLMDEALATAPGLQVSTLILYGERDEVIPGHSLCHFVRTLPHNPHRHWRVAIYPEGYHMLTRDLQAETVLKDIAVWLFKPRSPFHSGAEWRPGEPGSSLAALGHHHYNSCPM